MRATPGGTRPGVRQRHDDHGGERDRDRPRRGLGQQRAEPARPAARRRSSPSPRRRRSPPPTSSPASAPGTVSRRHQMPSTSSGQNVRGGHRERQPDHVGDRQRRSRRRPAPAGRRPPAASPARKPRTAPRSRSCEITPATDTVSPDEVDRNAANAPPVTSARQQLPAAPADERGRGSAGRRRRSARSAAARACRAARAPRRRRAAGRTRRAATAPAAVVRRAARPSGLV